MSEEFKSEEAIVENFKGLGFDLDKLEKDSSENFVFYDSRDVYNQNADLGFFKDNKGNWHDLHFGQWYSYDSDTYNEKDESKHLKDLRDEHHIMDDEGHIYYIKEGKPAEDTGYKRERSGSHLDSAYLFRDAFVIDNKNDVIGDPDHDVYGSENITKNKLYKRQEDGSYKQIWESKDCIFQKAGFPDNVYFSGGSWRNPKMETYFIDGKVDEAIKQKIENAVKLEKLRHTKDPLQEKEEALESAVSRAQRGLRFRRRRDGKNVNSLIEAEEKIEIMQDQSQRVKMKFGKTGDSLTGEITPEQRKVGEVQKAVAKNFMLKRRQQNEG